MTLGHMSRTAHALLLSGECLNSDESRVFLNLWFANPMVCMRVALREDDGNHENDANNKDNSVAQTATMTVGFLYGAGPETRLLVTGVLSKICPRAEKPKTAVYTQKTCTN